LRRPDDLPLQCIPCWCTRCSSDDARANFHPTRRPCACPSRCNSWWTTSCCSGCWRFAGHRDTGNCRDSSISGRCSFGSPDSRCWRFFFLGCSSLWWRFFLGCTSLCSRSSSTSSDVHSQNGVRRGLGVWHHARRLWGRDRMRVTRWHVCRGSEARLLARAGVCVRANWM